mmetsp:Transcript_11016/g.16647  ORF Transcript_11016/g.16647 Transcript_11016/m.16647 type:complete len:1109 (-) Transcript_11016:83-3409(-)|eukprot:CAMPEP_0116019470 /NCGR_PEP_ID=MMETSP0321-20121206/9258_1 /TAXON_ID=163516 /ORGANISM="Leptocylindrus danicus var. danicus, Strain B650" /LENGTH=1108 /DNA_ID=CAMNT_0003490051 /DNA_START=268 /DNA_END=3594 /DNA_ORIENTATION=+
MDYDTTFNTLTTGSPFNVQLLDDVIATAYNPIDPNRAVANKLLMALQQHEGMWVHVDRILESGSTNPQLLFFALQILEDTIKVRWNILPEDQRSGIKNYIVSKVIAVSTMPNTSTDPTMSLYLNKLNMVLIGIVKKEWPHNWPTFITDLVGSSRSSEMLCENNMKLLMLLSEEVFDFSKDQMTTKKVTNLKHTLNTEFTQIFQLCEFILQHSTQVSLLRVTLQTLQRFLTWIPLGFIFQTGLLDVLVHRFFCDEQYRNEALDCIAEIGALKLDTREYDAAFLKLMVDMTNQLQQMGVRYDNPSEAINVNGGGSMGMNNGGSKGSSLSQLYLDHSDREEQFVHKLALYFTGYCKTHLMLLEQNNPNAASLALNYLLRISEVPDVEIFKITVECWHTLTHSLYDQTKQAHSANMAIFKSNSSNSRSSKLNQLYIPVLHTLRHILISKMSKPEEVLVITDEDNNVIRESTKDTEQLALYKSMRECLVYCTNLNWEDTEGIMLKKLTRQVDGSEWSWNNLNTLCWAIGSISGAMEEDMEKRFLVTVIKDLLGLCEMKRGKDNKAIIASNIMYVVGQYPRFLRAHWKFLKTVVNKLFEFMHEVHPGVQDMACDTFLKIAMKCKRKFMTVQVDEVRPFICELVENNNLSGVVGDLEPHQVQAFYEAVGTMMSDRTPIVLQGSVRMEHSEILHQLMMQPNTAWRTILANGSSNPAQMTDSATLREVIQILKLNTRMVQTIGSIYTSQLENIFQDLLNLYRHYSQYVLSAVASQGAIATQMSTVRLVRSAKKEIVRLFSSYIEKSGPPEADAAAVVSNILPPILDPVLSDYSKSVANARDMEVLVFVFKVVSRLKSHVSDLIPKLFEHVFPSTLEMITVNYEDFPEHRVQFYYFIKSVIKNCFASLFNIPAEQQKLTVDVIVWATKHTERNISDMGLDILYELLQNVGRTPNIAQGFYRQYLLALIQDVLSVMTDRLHKSGFRMHATLLRHMFHLIQMNQVTVPLFDPATAPAGQTNPAYVREYVCNMLLNGFQTLTPSSVSAFVEGMFNLKMDLNSFKTHLRDFLVQVKEFSNEDNSGLYQEEAEMKAKEQAEAILRQRQSVPGILKPSEIDDDL